MKIQYPTFKVKSSPTPCEKLVICDSCGYAKWTAFGTYVIICRNPHPDGKHFRMREATPTEYKIGKETLTTEIG